MVSWIQVINATAEKKPPCRVQAPGLEPGRGATPENFVLLGYQTLKEHEAPQRRTVDAKTKVPHFRFGENEAFPGPDCRTGRL